VTRNEIASNFRDISSINLDNILNTLLDMGLVYRSFDNKFRVVD